MPSLEANINALDHLDLKQLKDLLVIYEKQEDYGMCKKIKDRIEKLNGREKTI